MKRLVKQFIGLIVLFFLPVLLRKHKRQVLILSYHRILPVSHPEYKTMQPGMVVSDDTFRNHVLWLTRYLKIIRLQDIKKYQNENIKPACVITLDDGWVDNYQYAFPILKELKTVANIFLVPNMIGTDNYFWPEKLGLLMRNKTSAVILQQHIKIKYGSELQSVEGYDALIEVLKSKSDEEIFKILNQTEKDASDSGGLYKTRRQVLNPGELQEMAESGFIDYGSHTANHVRLDKVAATKVVDELRNSKQQLETLLAQDITTFCYPNGSYTDKVVSLVSKCYELACTTDKGWTNNTDNAYKLKRVMLHDDISNTKSLFWGTVLGFF